ncbi:unnamed protein product [Larinioides sclopetarius]|uniref:Uncharacterized protein n=1 Tax=Larinioides sclopetarius TaxID=280406 RepID=A0AAV2A5U3_9ARAC
MQSSFHSKLKSIEEKIEGVGSKYHMLERKIEDIINNIKESALKVTSPKFSDIPSDACVPKFMSANSEEAYPDGSWLGDPNNSDLRVRCSISPVTLHTNRTNNLQINGESQSTTNLMNPEQNMIITKAEPPMVEYLQEHELAEIIPLKLEPDGYSITFTEGIATQIIHTEHGDIQVIQGTEEQLEQLKQNHSIEILSQADILNDSVLDVTE